METGDLLRKSIDSGDWANVLFYDQLYRDDLYDAGERHPVWTPRQCLTYKADCMSSYEKFEEALEVLKTILEMDLNEGLDLTRPVFQDRHDIAQILMEQNKFDDALSIIKPLLVDRVLGEETDIQDILNAKLIMACCLENKGELESALEFYEQVYSGYSDICGSEISDFTAAVGFSVISVKFKMEALKERSEGRDMNFERILNIVDYGPTVFSMKIYGEDGKEKDSVVRTNDGQMLAVVFQELISKCDGDSEKLKKFLNFENSELRTPLNLAVENDCTVAVKFLLDIGVEHGLDVNKPEGFSGKNALVIATHRRNEIIQKLLVDAGVRFPDKSERRLLLTKL